MYSIYSISTNMNVVSLKPDEKNIIFCRSEIDHRQCGDSLQSLHYTSAQHEHCPSNKWHQTYNV